MLDILCNVIIVNGMSHIGCTVQCHCLKLDMSCDVSMWQRLTDLVGEIHSSPAHLDGKHGEWQIAGNRPANSKSSPTVRLHQHMSSPTIRLHQQLVITNR